jgi:hypothetical protein
MREIQEGLSNPAFSTVQPTPTDVVPYIDNFAALLTQTRLGNKTLITQRDNLRRTITNMVGSQCNGVNQIADGDLEILELSGFTINKLREKRPLPSKGEPLAVTVVGPKCAEFRAHGITNSDFIEVEVDGPQGFCKVYSSKQSKVKVNNLPVGVELKACVRGVNAHGEGDWSNTVTFMLYGSTQHDDSVA